ncbi:type II/IV secretion system protein [bacterium]|nr:type II/IV secretion system protein [candidate division CSSED10-310 bacterium]
MKSAGQSDRNDLVTFSVITVVLGTALIFAFTYNGIAPDTLLFRVHSFLSHPISLILIIGGLIFMILGAVTEALRDFRSKEAMRQRLRQQQENLIKPIRLYDMTFDENVTNALGLNEIPGKIAQLTRRGDQGIPDLVDALIGMAIQIRASDIHIEPSADIAVIRYRQDGILNDVGQIPMSLISRVSSRLRVLANLTIYEKGKPQDGRIDVKWNKNQYDIRISFLPTLHGDKIVIRLFESGEHQFNILNLGFYDESLAIVTELLLRPQGTIFLTGPTGSGKTTTIYSAIRFVLQHRGETTNIVTIEDPIEREISGVNQTQVNPKRDLTFASGLRSILRQDPDVIVVGEVRDHETAEICTQAGLTGHLVISTIHADSAVGVFNRLIDMGIEPFLVASSICGIVSQRLIKRNCPNCSEPIVPSLRALKALGIRPDLHVQFMKGKGCDQCDFKGFRGRIGIFEILLPTQRLKDALQKKVSTGELHQIAREEGMITLHSDGLQKVKDGLVNVEELARVLI